ncbi:trypsin-3-like isoform X2 [Diachasmimorpha longicaudata]|uniref:trypsin-3-like isoform X2 n=1 Tax=Diachasmimorpha longicaudata TaxID=58733 RepID=UPI0030B8A055
MFFGKVFTIIVICICIIFYNIIEDVNGGRLRRMINAFNATTEEFPSHAFVHAMYIQYGRYSSFYCGGSLVTASHILTAAHCTFDIDELMDTARSLRPRELFVTLGVNRVQETSDNYSVMQIHRHEQYSGRSSRNPWSLYDIAILELHEEVSLHTTRQIINLPCDNPDLGDKGILLGVSPPSADYQSGGNLQKAQFKVVECTDWAETGLICVSSKTANVTEITE